MKYYYKCTCGSEHQINTDIKISDKKEFKCFKCGKKFKFEEKNDTSNSERQTEPAES